jgi:DNA-binding MarR family transcriptional regulator
MNDGETASADRTWFRLMRLQTRLGAVVGDRLRTIGLSVPQCDVLATLTEREGVSQQELALRLYVTKGNISGLIDRLEAAGFVERRRTEGDRRSHAIFLTPAGRDLAERGVDIQRAFVAETIGRLAPGDIQEFESLIIAVRDFARKANSKRRAPKMGGRPTSLAGDTRLR